MRITDLELDGLKLVDLESFRDKRGFLVERYNEAVFAEHGLPTAFAQDNHSRSMPGVLRGLHYQHSPAQGKLVGVVRGAIWDVMVDLRPQSPTFGRCTSVTLDEERPVLLWIPAGFAHGFCVVGEEPADVLYKVDAPYNPHGEGGIHWADPDLAIEWPLDNPSISERDDALPSFEAYSKSPAKFSS